VATRQDKQVLANDAGDGEMPGCADAARRSPGYGCGADGMQAAGSEIAVHALSTVMTRLRVTARTT
jgi:hypothetical protein